jgi:hypothetical protein
MPSCKNTSAQKGYNVTKSDLRGQTCTIHRSGALASGVVVAVFKAQGLGNIVDLLHALLGQFSKFTVQCMRRRVQGLGCRYLVESASLASLGFWDTRFDIRVWGTGTLLNQPPWLV